jgi:alpha-glucosidase
VPADRRDWWRDAAIYQLYPRSFADGNGDGVGDLAGVRAHLDYLHRLGINAIWFNPWYLSPMADAGYDVTDYREIDPLFGTLAEAEQLIEEAHERGIRVIADIVPNHCSNEHAWFREALAAGPGSPARDLFWFRPGRGELPPNDWESIFGGPAWTRVPDGEWYLHLFAPEQPDLNWNDPRVHAEFEDVLRFWFDRGVDGFRVDALTAIVKDAELRDDPPASGGFPLPHTGVFGEIEHLYSSNRPEAVDALAALREAAGDALLVGEVYLGTPEYPRWLEHVDLVFAFELLFSPWDAEALRAAIGPAAELGRIAWVLSNHDFDRLASRVGPENVRAAAMLLLTLPGAAFVYQGDEIGLPNGPSHEPAYDRAGRDRLRHPMQWDPGGGFTTGDPWLPPIDPEERNVEAQRGDPGSLLELYRRLLAFRRELGEDFRLIDAEPGVVAYVRGSHTVAINTTAEPRTAPQGELVLATNEAAGLPPHAGLIVRK